MLTRKVYHEKLTRGANMAESECKFLPFEPVS